MSHRKWYPRTPRVNSIRHLGDRNVNSWGRHMWVHPLSKRERDRDRDCRASAMESGGPLAFGAAPGTELATDSSEVIMFGTETGKLWTS